MAQLHDWVPPTRFAQANGARLAYQLFGDGDAQIAAIPPLAQDIEIAWEQPAIRAMLERFGSFSRYLVFDKRGTGASDRRSDVPGIDERVEDLRAVMDAAEFDTAHLFVQSDGGPMALMFAATYPERVESLILNGSYAAISFSGTEEERIARRDRFVSEWGTPDSKVVDRFAPSLADDEVFRSWHQRYERHAADRNSLRDLIDLSHEIDASEVLSAIDVPTLVQHRIGDRIVPVEVGRKLAAAIPNAQMIEYESDDHYAYVGDIDLWMTDVERFVTGTTRVRTTPVPRSVVNISVLGGFAVSVGGHEVPISEWGSRHARQLCKRLVIAGQRPVTRDELIDMLWPDEHDRRRLSARLSVQLSTVRRILRGGVIADRQMVRLDFAEVTTDLDSFESAATDEAIIDAYPGELLPEDRYDDWTIEAREAARTTYIGAVRRTAAAALAEGDHLAAADLMRRIIAADRYDTAAHELLVDALAKAGETGAARRAHQAWEAVMAELDIAVPPFGGSRKVS